MTRILSVFNFLKRVGFAVFVLGGSMIANAQPPDTMWTHVYPEVEMEPRTFALTADGGFIVAGVDGFPTDAALTKIDSSGNLEWSRRYDTDNWVTLFDVTETPNHDIVAVGLRFGFPHHFDFATYLLCTDSSGDTLWTSEYNLDDEGDELQSVLVVDDGLLCVGKVGYVGTLVDSGDALIMKLDFDGDTLWTKRYGTEHPDFAYDIIKMSEDRYLITGTAGDFNTLLPTEAFALLIDGAGDSLWMRTYENDGRVLCVDANSDGHGGFLLTGSFDSINPETSRRAYALRGDSVGTELWQTSVGDSLIKVGNEIRNVSSGSIVLGSQGPTSVARFYVARLTDGGDTLWTALYGSSWAFSGLEGLIMDDGGYMMMGIQHAPDPNPSGLMLIRTYPEGRNSAVSTPTVSSIGLLDAYPNPFNSNTTVRYSLTQSSKVELVFFNLLGRQVRRIQLDRQAPGDYALPFDSNGLASGIYFIQLRTHREAKTVSIILEK